MSHSKEHFQPVEDPAGGDIAALQAAFRSGTLAPSARLDRCLTAARSTPASFITLMEERARAEAAASDARHADGKPRGPLDGIVVSYKDIIDSAGTRTTAGSPLGAESQPAAADAPIVSALTDAGAIAIGKTNLTEFAFSVLGVNPHFGTPDNPRHPGHVPGGSSSGAAVAIARGACTIAVGSDTSGSIRVPAAFCGLAGFKPSPGRYPMAGVFPLAPSLDTLGFLARRARDIALVDEVLAGDAGRITSRAAGRDLSRWPIIVPEGVLTEDLEAPVAAAFEIALQRIAAAGGRIERRPVPAIEAAQMTLSQHGAMVGFEAVKVHAALLAAPARLARIDPNVRQRLQQAARRPAEDYVALVTQRARLAADLAADIGEAILVCPTVPHLAPECAPLLSDPARFAAVNLRTLRNTMLGSYLRLPGLALPAGPASLLASAAEGHDERLLAIGPALEAALAPLE